MLHLCNITKVLIITFITHDDGSHGVGFLPRFVCVSVCFFSTMSQNWCS